MSEQDQSASGTPHENSVQPEQKAETKSKDQVSYETYQRVLVEAKKAKDKAKELESVLNQQKEEKMKQENQWKELYEQEKSRISEIENQLKEKEELVNNSLKYDAFKKALGADLVSDDFLDKIGLDKIILDPDTKKVNMDSAKMLAMDFAKKHPYLLKPASGKLPQAASANVSKVPNGPIKGDQIKELLKEKLTNW